MVAGSNPVSPTTNSFRPGSEGVFSFRGRLLFEWLSPKSHVFGPVEPGLPLEHISIVRNGSPVHRCSVPCRPRGCCRALTGGVFGVAIGNDRPRWPSLCGTCAGSSRRSRPRVRGVVSGRSWSGCAPTRCGQGTAALSVAASTEWAGRMRCQPCRSRGWPAHPLSLDLDQGRCRCCGGGLGASRPMFSSSGAEGSPPKAGRPDPSGCRMVEGQGRKNLLGARFFENDDARTMIGQSWASRGSEVLVVVPVRRLGGRTGARSYSLVAGPSSSCGDGSSPCTCRSMSGGSVRTNRVRRGTTDVTEPLFSGAAESNCRRILFGHDLPNSDTARQCRRNRHHHGTCHRRRPGRRRHSRYGQ